MKTCSNCGQEIVNSNSKYCPKCGSNIMEKGDNFNKKHNVINNHLNKKSFFDSKNNMYILIVILVILILGAGIYLYKNNSDKSSFTQDDINLMDENSQYEASENVKEEKEAAPTTINNNNNVIVKNDNTSSSSSSSSSITSSSSEAKVSRDYSGYKSYYLLQDVNLRSSPTMAGSSNVICKVYAGNTIYDLGETNVYDYDDDGRERIWIKVVTSDGKEGYVSNRAINCTDKKPYQ